MSDHVPRCVHGNIILGCPKADCDEQTVYLIDQATRLAEWERRQRNEVRRIVAAAAHPRRHQMTYHWHCDCGAYGNSNAWDANVLIIRLHRERGHTVTSWPRGRPKETQTLAAFPPPGDTK